MSVEILPKSAVYSHEVREFARRHDLGADLDKAIGLANQSFPSALSMEVCVDTDPEEDGEWIVIEIVTTESVNEFLKSYDRCADLWVTELPSKALAMIRLSYSFA